MNNILISGIFREFVHSAFFVILSCVLLTTNVLPGSPTIESFLVSLIMHIFGYWFPAHGNPTVTYTWLMLRRLTVKHAVFYIISQFLGVVVGNRFVSVFFPESFIIATTYMDCPNIPKEDPSFIAIYCQEILYVVTFLMIYEVLRNPFCELYYLNVPALPGHIIGSCYKAERFYHGATLNLARTFFAAIMQNDFTNLHIYIMAHVAGVCICLTIYCAFCLYPRPQQDEPPTDSDAAPAAA